MAEDIGHLGQALSVPANSSFRRDARKVAFRSFYLARPLSKQFSIEGRDFDFVAQRQQAIRLGQGGLLVLILFAATTFLVLAHSLLTAVQWITVLGATVCFSAWSLWGTRRINEYFQQGYRADEAPTKLLGGSRMQTVIHFTGMYLLIGLIYRVAVEVGELRFLWLFLLVPVGHAALFLPIWTTALAYLTSTGILLWAVYEVHGAATLIVAMMQFSLAAVFVFVFAQIAASAERGRAEVALLVAELTQVNRQLSQYSVQAEELAVTRERNELARNIHDSVGHVLTAVNIQLRAAQAMIGKDVGSANEAIARAQELSVSGLAEIRSSVSALRTSPLEGKSLQEAISETLAGGSRLGFQTGLQVLGEPRLLPPAVALALYRATQEGITNVRKHSQATQVQIELDYHDPEQVRLTVRDDGAGADSLSGGFGLVGLRERAELLGGSLTVQSVPDGGVELEMRLPG